MFEFIQIIKADTIVSEEQLICAAEETIAAFKGKTNFAKTKNLEFLLRCAGTRQLDKALKILGIEKGEQKVVVIGVCQKTDSEKMKKEIEKLISKINLKEDKDLFEKNLKNEKALMKTYSIDEKELEALKDLPRKNALKELVLEKISLISLQE